MRGVAAALAVSLALVAIPLGAGQLRPFGGPVLAAEAPQGATGADLEYRYAFFVTGAAEAYVKNNPAPYNAAFGRDWTTRVALHGPAGARDIGPLVSDHPLELGPLQANTTYGLAFAVHVPAADLANATTLRLSYVLALHRSTCACEDSGASLDPSVGVSFEATVRPNAPPQDLRAWTLPAVPAMGSPDWPDGNPGPSGGPGATPDGSPAASIDWGFWGLGVAAAALLVLFAARRRHGPAGASAGAAVAPVAAAAPVAPVVAPASAPKDAGAKGPDPPETPAVEPPGPPHDAPPAAPANPPESGAPAGPPSEKGEPKADPDPEASVTRP